MFHWQKAAGLAPDMFSPRLNLARYLRRAGQVDDALEQYRKAAALASNDLEIRKELAALLMDTSRHGEALDNLNYVLDNGGGDQRFLNAKAGCLAALGRLGEACREYESLLAASPGYWQSRYNYALLLNQNARYAESAQNCRLLAESKPDFSAGLALWAENLLRLEQYNEAAEVLRRCLELEPGSAQLHSLYGLSLMRMGNLEQAEASLKRSLEIDPRNAAALQNLAALLSQSLRYDEALEPAMAGLTSVPDSIDLALIASKCLLNTQDAEKADAFLTSFLAGTDQGLAGAQPDKLGDLHLEMADLKDRLGQSRESFEHTLAGNRAKAKLVRPWLQGAELFKRQIAELYELYQSGKLELIKPLRDTAQVPPVFLVGFPRSGTTLFKQILDMHSRIAALDEKPGFQYVREAMARELAGGFPGGLAGMGQAGRELYAAIYREDVSRRTQAGPGVMILDKSPLDMVFAGPLNLLFPEVKFILMARHPLDACLSCLMRNFTLQERTVDFVALETTVALYEKAFDLWRVYTEQAGLGHHLIRYEDLVVDMPGQTRQVLGYLGLEWEDELLNYRGGIKNDGQTISISHHQVAEPLYQRARYRWQRYAEFLEPCLDRLAPYCLWLGYDDPRLKDLA